MARHNELGKWGEQIAHDYLVAQGFGIYAQDTTRGRNEVDLIAMKDDGIHFVEVKTRSTGFADPLDAIDSAKIRRICRYAEGFIREHSIRLRPQFDAIAIIGTPETGVQSLTYYPDLFFPPLNSYK